MKIAHFTCALSLAQLVEYILFHLTRYSHYIVVVCENTMNLVVEISEEIALRGRFDNVSNEPHRPKPPLSITIVYYILVEGYVKKHGFQPNRSRSFVLTACGRGYVRVFY